MDKIYNNTQLKSKRQQGKTTLKLVFPPGWLPGECSRLKPPHFPFECMSLNASLDNNNYNDNNNKGVGGVVYTLQNLKKRHAALPSLADTTRTASARINWLAFAQFGWKRNANNTWSGQTVLIEPSLADFGFLPQLVGVDNGHECC